MQRNGRLHAFNDKFFQRPAHAHDGGVAGRRVHDQLGDHAVIKRRDGVTRINFGIHPYAEAARRMPFGNFTRAGSESLRVFGVDPAFDCMTVELDVLLFKAERGAAGNADLFADDVNAADGFGYRMFDLQAGIHLQKIEFAVFIQKFQRSGIEITDLGNRLADNFADFFPLRLV